LQQAIKYDDLQRIYELCENIAKLQLETEEFFEAKIEKKIMPRIKI